MTVSAVAKVLSLTIPNGSANSNALSANDDYGDAVALGLISPATLDGGHTYKFQVSLDGTNFFDLQVGNPLADEIVPAVSNATVYYNLIVWPYFRIVDATGNVAGDRTFLVCKQYTSP